MNHQYLTLDAKQFEPYMIVKDDDVDEIQPLDSFDEEDDYQQMLDTDEGLLQNNAQVEAQQSYSEWKMKQSTQATIEKDKGIMENAQQYQKSKMHSNTRVALKDLSKTNENSANATTEQRLNRKLRAFQDHNDDEDISSHSEEGDNYQTLTQCKTLDVRLAEKHSSNQHQRTIEQFLKDQKTLEDLRLQRQLQLQEHFAKQKLGKLKAKPTLNRNTIKLAQQKNIADNHANMKENIHPNIHSRLFNQALVKTKAAQMNKCSSSENLNKTIKLHQRVPQGDVTNRAQQISTRLFNDFNQRRQSQEKLLTSARQQESAVLNQKQEYKTLVQKNQSLAIQKLRKEIVEVASKNQHHKSKVLSYIDFKSMLKDLGYITSLSSATNERALIEESWLAITKYQPLTIQSMSDFLCGIEKLKPCKYLDDQMLLRMQQLCINKRAKPGALKQKEYQDLTFKPHISRSSEKLAWRKRERQLSSSVLSGAFKNLNTDDILTELRLIPIEARQQQQLESATKTEDKELSELTFQPQILKRSEQLDFNRSQTSQDIHDFDGDRCTQLYQRSMYRERRDDKSSLDIEYEKNKEHCTFKPTLVARSRSRRSSFNDQTDGLQQSRSFTGLPAKFGQTSNAQNESSITMNSSKTAEKVQFIKRNECSRDFQRQSQTKQPRQNDTLKDHSKSTQSLQNILNAMSSSNHEESFKVNTPHNTHKSLRNQQPMEPRRPLLYVNVNIAPGMSEKITVQYGDSANILAEKFALKHNLNSEVQIKLEKLLESQISQILLHSQYISQKSFQQ